VLCCIGQFELPEDIDCFLDALTYGLFKPLCSPMMIEAEHNRTARKWTKELLRAMAHQMRRSRRLGVWSTCASILLFFVAYAVSVVLAFSDLGERTTTHSLAFGILITWFPLLIFFSILDRNPNSADRTRKFISRWLWNVRAVKHWEDARDTHRDHTQPSSTLTLPNWWSPSKQRLNSTQPSTPDGGDWVSVGVIYHLWCAKHGSMGGPCLWESPSWKEERDVGMEARGEGVGLGGDGVFGAFGGVFGVYYLCGCEFLRYPPTSYAACDLLGS